MIKGIYIRVSRTATTCRDLLCKVPASRENPGESQLPVGLMSEAQAGAYFFTSGKIVNNGLAYAGEELV